MKDKTSNKPLVAPVHIARKYNVTSRTVLNWAESNVIPTAIRVGRVVRFDEDEVDKALKERSRQGA